MLRFKTWATAGLLLFLSLPSEAEYKLLHKPDAKDPLRVHEYELANGLRVYLTENHEEPRFYTEIAVRAGSKHDPSESTGIAHYLEHMLFKGTSQIGTTDFAAEEVHLDRIEALYEEHAAETDEQRRAEIYAEINAENQRATQFAVPNELDRTYAAMGERGLNAHTWVEETVYRVDLPSNRLEHWVRVESERFAHPVFRLFQTELETVYEEKNRSLDNKGRLIREAVGQFLYKRHPYGQQTTLGSVEHLKNPSLRRMHEFYETYYVPNNMGLFISGDIEIDEAIALIDEHFSAWESRPLPRPKKWKEKRLKSVERVTVQYPGEEYVLLAFRTAALSHKDAEALQILDMILDNRVAGLINLNLSQAQRVRDAGSYPWQHNEYGAQYLWGIPKKDQSLEEVEELLLEQIDIIREGGFDDWIIPAIVTDFEKTHKRKYEGNGARVGLIRESFIAGEEWVRWFRTLERMNKLKKKDIVRVAKRYFKENYVAGYRRDGEPELPSIEKPAIDKIDIDPSRESAFIAEIMAIPYKEIEPDYVVPGRDFKVRDVREGVKLYHSHNPLNDLFTLGITVEVGHLADRRFALARELMDKSGTSELTPVELKKEWYRLGTDFSISSSDHRTTITVSGLDGNFDPSLQLAMDFIRNPTADAETFKDLIPIILKRREDAMKDHRTISRALYQFNRLGEKSPHRRVLSNEEVEALTGDELHALIRSLLEYEATITYTGSQSVDEVLARISAHFTTPEKLRSAPPYEALEARQPESTEIYFFDKEMAQAQVRIEIGDEVYNESRRPAVQLYNEYFGGSMAGIVFQELREARALAYSANARYLLGEHQQEQNMMAGAIGCQADKTPEAVAAFVELIDNLPVSADRFAAAQRSQINQYRTSHLSFRRVLGAVLTWQRQGVAVDPRSWRLQQIQAAGLDDVVEFQKERLAGRPKLISIVGDKKKIDLEALAAHGSVTELGVEDIFGF